MPSVLAALAIIIITAFLVHPIKPPVRILLYVVSIILKIFCSAENEYIHANVRPISRVTAWEILIHLFFQWLYNWKNVFNGLILQAQPLTLIINQVHQLFHGLSQSAYLL